MDLTFLFNFINPLILAVCLLVGYVIKTALPSIPNRFIPLAALTMGTLLAIIANFPGINMEVIVGGMISGLASTGLYEMLHNLLDKDGKKEVEGE